MGNAVLCAFPQAPSVVKLVHCNGLVEEFYRPVQVGELSPDYPLHFICPSQGLLSLLNAAALTTAPSAACSTTPSSSSSSSLPALADDDYMQLGQIYFLLPLHSPLSQPSITSLFSKSATFARKTSYQNLLHVPPFSSPEMQEDSLDYAPTSQDFVQQLMAETRLQLPTRMTGPFLIDPLERQLPAPSSAASFDGSRPQHQSNHPAPRPSRDPWRPPLETILEEANLFVT